MLRNLTYHLRILGRNYSGEFPKKDRGRRKVKGNGRSLSATEKSENFTTNQSE